MVTGEAPVKRVDHIAIRAEHLGPVHSLFSDTLGLPVTWPVTAYPLYTSVAVCAGNVDLEILQLGGRGSGSAPTPAGASLYGIAFGSRGLAESVARLDRRHISRSAPIPQVGVWDGGDRGTLWATVYLGGLIDRSFVMTLFMTASKLLPRAFFARVFASEWFGRSPMAGLLWSVMPKKGVAFLVDWGPSFLKDLRRDRESAEAALRAQDGGPLGLRGVKEIVVGVEEFEDTDRRWHRLLAPTRPTAPGVWDLGKGLSIRFVRSTRNAIQALVLQVASLDQARSFLRETKLLGDISDGQITVDASAAHGLDIRLVE